jgi:predicted regulator of Ras-like GTPase activity (Roadblock/LC7/MglB family)
VLEKIDTALELLLKESKAKCALVIDRTGCILSSGGDFYPLAQDTMGAVAAGVIAALNTMVSRASSPEVSVKFYGGDIDKVHFVVIADRLVLCMLHSRQITSGQIRSAAKTFGAAVQQAIDQSRNESTETDELARSVQFIESKLNDMFKDYL